MNCKELVKQDFGRWCEHHSLRKSIGTWLKFLADPCNRKLLAFRLKEKGMKRSLLNLSSFYNTVYFPYNSQFEELGGGLLIIHSFSIIISCRRIGSNCTIFQQVTIGASNTGVPTIGNDVTIYCGAKVLGGITIGDDVQIGANAVVVNDVPSHCIVAGVPAKIIKTRDASGNWRKI